MANMTYLSLTGVTQGRISAGCCSRDSIANKSQTTHIDQIMVYAITHNISRNQNVNHHEMVIVKPVDKSSPLLGKAISENEELNCTFDIYRSAGGIEFAAGGVLALFSAPVIVDVGFTIILGAVLNCTLNVLDERYHISVSIKEKVREAFQDSFKIRQWHQQHLPYDLYLFYNSRN